MLQRSRPHKFSKILSDMRLRSCVAQIRVALHETSLEACRSRTIVSSPTCQLLWTQRLICTDVIFLAGCADQVEVPWDQTRGCI
mmetsp:Transcript_82967/g.216209  ORF Transcript_82967/g.216209 Transcript_82967/m.216209 type:complete len:84 (-) Transcript_82967:15-266(-)